MKPNISIWLDVVRFVAAVAVLLGHCRRFIAPALPKIVAVHGSEAVAIFFVLSGFVISHVVSRKEASVSDYLVARVTRILSVAIPALALTALCDLIGNRYNPSYYANLEFWGGHLSAHGVMVCLSFLNEAWGWHFVPGSNEAYWSLGYEVPYYIAFAATFITSTRWRLVAWTLWGLLFGPYVAAYAALWGMGVALYGQVEKIGNRAPGAGKAGGWLLLLAPVLYPLLKYGLFPPLGTLMRHESLGMFIVSWTYYMLIGALFAAHLLGFAWLSSRRSLFPSAFVRVTRWFAGATFSVYLMHMPLIVLLGALGDHWGGGAVRGVIGTVLVFAITLLLAEFGERRKDLLKRLVAWFFGRLYQNGTMGRSDAS
jgi:peptidoglycan/LPS O-acetylase OafA/YrhL